MKTLKDLTPEIQAKIPEYINKALLGVFDGGRYDSFIWENAYSCVKLQYEKCGYSPPIMLVAENPYEAQIMFNYVKNHPVWSKVICSLGEVDFSQLYSQLDSQLYSQLRSQLDSQLYSQLRSQLYSQLDSQLGSQLYSQLRSQLDSQLDSQLRSQLDSQLRSQLYSQLDSQLGSQLYSQLRSQLGEYNNAYLFTSNIWSLAYFAYYNFINKELKVSGKIEKELEVFSSAYENSNIYNAIFSEALCVVSKFPKRVYRDSENRLHNPKGYAVGWGSLTDQTKFECYSIHGRNIPKNIAEIALNGELTKEVFTKEQNDEYRSAWYNYLGEEKMLDVLEATEVDRFIVTHNNDEQEVITLFKTKDNLNTVKNKPYAWLKRICPSTGNVYLTPTNPDFKSAEESAKFHRPDWVPLSLGYHWYSRS
jgi:hypothetical protein